MNTPLPFCVYVLFSMKDKLFYIGYTTKLEQRIINHSKGFTKSTKGRRPLILVFCEYYLSKEDAKRREKYFKTTAGKKALNLMLRSTKDIIGYKSKSVDEGQQQC